MNRCSCFSKWKFSCPLNFGGLVALGPQLSDGFKLSCEFSMFSVLVVERVGAGLFLAFCLNIILLYRKTQSQPNAFSLFDMWWSLVLFKNISSSPTSLYVVSLYFPESPCGCVGPCEQNLHVSLPSLSCSCSETLCRALVPSGTVTGKL